MPVQLSRVSQDATVQAVSEENQEKEELQQESAPRYRDKNDKIGASLVFFVIFYTGLLFGVTVAFTCLWRVFGHGLIPITQVCECPVNSHNSVLSRY